MTFANTPTLSKRLAHINEPLSRFPSFEVDQQEFDMMMFAVAQQFPTLSTSDQRDFALCRILRGKKQRVQ